MGSGLAQFTREPIGTSFRSPEASAVVGGIGGHSAVGQKQRGQGQRLLPALAAGRLASSRSLSAAKKALRKMGLSSSERDLDTVAAGLTEELELRPGAGARPGFPDRAYAEVGARLTADVFGEAEILQTSERAGGATHEP